jgi:hypothetical protein
VKSAGTSVVDIRMAFPIGQSTVGNDSTRDMKDR